MKLRVVVLVMVACLLGSTCVHAGFVGIGPISGMEATGDKGLITSINDIAVEDLVLGTTTFPNDPKHSQYPPEGADNFDLDMIGSADDQPYFDTMFDQGVATVFLIENNGNDNGSVQALDESGAPVNSVLDFVKSDYLKTGYKTTNNQTASGLMLTTDSPVYGVRVLPPADGTLGFDPVSVSAVVPEPMTVSLLGLGALALMRRRRS